ncbi:MAG: hypothetical protein HY910_13445 [Desulfarculus sp.]|nr:hypothetical protein [Desulfarculus sp.]
MTAAADSSKQWLLSLADLGFNLQWLSIKAQWQPALIQALAPMASDCLAILRRELTALAGDPETPPGWPALSDRLSPAWATVVTTRGQAGKALLLAMVKEVVEETGRIATINGLIGAAPALHAPGQDPRAALEALAGGPAVDGYVKKGFAEFGQAVMTEIKRGLARGLPPQELFARCQPAAARWRNRLTMLARTLAFEVFNRARRAAYEKLR